MGLERLGKYELLECLGRGGMGEVWKARDTQLGRYVAIKLLHADLQANPDFVTHFLREAQLVASLHHANIVQVHDFQLADKQGSSVKAYMVMDYIEGGTLADYIANTVRKGRFPPAADIVSLFTSISLALDYAHQKGMIHRDIKPANILMDTSTATTAAGKALGEPILTDFGIARLQGANTSTVTRAMLGTPRYISPEQAESRTVDERSDLYSLGIVLYEILTGITPFRGDNAIVIMMQHIQEKPPPPDLINPNVTPALSSVVLRSIAKNPEERFPSASAMTVALAQAFGLPVPASLNKPRSIIEQPEYNPLQPFAPLPGIALHSPTQAVSTPAPFTPASAAYPVAPVIPPAIPPAHLTPAISDHAPPAVPLSPKRRQRRSLYIALTACIILLLVGISAFTVFPLLFSKNVTPATPTPNSSGGVVGHIVFVHSPNAAANIFDQLQINLENVATPPAGKTYYAWLETSLNEAVPYQHWQLQASNGLVRGGTYLSNPPHSDLFASSNKFLITEEDANSPAPDVPNFVLSSRLYYAIIPHTSSPSPTYEVRQCPQSSSNNAGNPCI